MGQDEPTAEIGGRRGGGSPRYRRTTALFWKYSVSKYRKRYDTAQKRNLGPVAHFILCPDLESLYRGYGIFVYAAFIQISMVYSIRFSSEEQMLIEQYATIRGSTISDVTRQAVMEMIRMNSI